MSEQKIQHRKKIQLSDHFTLGRMIRFTLPSIAMMIFTSIYGMVDGFFVSNYAGAVPFAALNLAFPFNIILSAIGFMFGTGGTALVSYVLGQGDKKKASELFSLITYVLTGCGVVLGLVGYFIAEPMSRLLGATEEMLPYSVLYIQINMLGIPFLQLQHLFQSFFVTAEKPKLGLVVTVLSGCANMLLDYLFVGVFDLGLAGAAWATVASEVVGGLVPVIYFFAPNSSILRLGKTHWYGKDLWKTCTNGSSEFLSNAASSIVGMLYNLQLMAYIGSNGVAAYGVLMYSNFIFVGIYFGYTMGIAPVFGYANGAKNTEELKGLFRKSIWMIGISSVVLTILAELTAKPIVSIFVGYDEDLLALTLHAFRIYAISFLFMGFNIFGSGLFTALNNGLISAILSILRSLVLQLITIYTLPLIFGADGLWSVVLVSEGVCLIVTIIMMIIYRKKYQY